ncbi:hypothetical protein [Brevibacterium aurantiacum]|uniref:P68 RBP/TagC-like beta-propeller domain-containing protein n=1 Tax=Brevibacterium aurantiacum TaxID=273384 RepID=A0A556C590_BREAU|nr:hypothetical protein [Brevibacterium aurantiacum]TSI12623.1 hypothetical protein FO013_19300 [Brevibacterium aurantiacum]
MALNVFGGSPGDVTADSSGGVIGGVTLKVYTSALGGQQVTELYDIAGAPLAGVVVSGMSGDDTGRIAFQASDQYQILFLDAGYGMRWAVPAREAFSAASTALSKSTAALTAAQEAQSIAAESGVKADLAKAEVDAKLGFDITKLSPQFVTTLRIPSNRVLQSAARDPLTGNYYAAQAGPANGSSTDLHITRCAPDGRMLDQCIFSGGGHGSTVAIENDGPQVWLWFRWTYDTTSGGYTNRMVRAQYQAGKTVLRDDALVSEVPDFADNTLVDFSIDQAADRICERVFVSSTREQFVLRKLSDYKAGRNQPVASLITDDSQTGVNPYQGHVSIDDHLYVARGGAGFGSPNTITRYQWDTDEKTLIDVDRVAAMPDGAFPEAYNEIEGVSMWRGPGGTPSLLFGKAIGSAYFRQAPIYAFTPPAGDDLVGETLRRIGQKERGVVTIKPSAANTPTSGAISFSREFDAEPHVSLTVRTNIAGTSATVMDVTAKGCTVWLTRPTTTDTLVYWQADAS